MHFRFILLLLPMIASIVISCAFVSNSIFVPLKTRKIKIKLIVFYFTMKSLFRISKFMHLLSILNRIFDKISLRSVVRRKVYMYYECKTTCYLCLFAVFLVYSILASLLWLAVSVIDR